MSPAMSPATSPVSFPAGTWQIFMFGGPNQPIIVYPPPQTWHEVMTLNLYQYGDVGNAPQYGGTAQVGLGLTSTQCFALENVTFNPGLGMVRFRITGLATLLAAT